MSLIGYAVIYTVFLKRATPQNIVIGGAAGAAPPVLGWAALNGTVTGNALLLLLIIFTWTPPHFWALAIARKADYERAGIPMLPVTHGEEVTKSFVVYYTILLLVVTVLPYLTGMSGLLYLFGALLLGAGFLYYAIAAQTAARHGARDADVRLLDHLSDRALQLPARRPLHSGLLARIIGPAPADPFRRRCYAMDVTDIIDPLNDAQRAAVTAPDRPTLVLAGAGSGKTRVLVHRIAWVIRVNGVAAQHVLAVTFTNKAAAEMRERIERLLGFPTRNLWIGTFHGLAHRLAADPLGRGGSRAKGSRSWTPTISSHDPPDAARARARRERVGAERDPVVHQRAERRGPAAEGPARTRATRAGGR